MVHPRSTALIRKLSNPPSQKMKTTLLTTDYRFSGKRKNPSQFGRATPGPDSLTERETWFPKKKKKKMKKDWVSGTGPPVSVRQPVWGGRGGGGADSEEPGLAGWLTPHPSAGCTKNSEGLQSAASELQTGKPERDRGQSFF